jgi:hypothetical protein
VHVVYKGNNRISDFFCEMLTSLQYKCVNKHAESESEVFSKSEIFGLGRPKSSGYMGVDTGFPLILLTDEYRSNAQFKFSMKASLVQW